MEFHYITDYSKELCLEYMQHDNVNDYFSYSWEAKKDKFLITFNEYKSSILSLENSLKPTFEVEFEEVGGSTSIKVTFLSNDMLSLPFVYTKDVDLFWKRKLNATRV